MKPTTSKQNPDITRLLADVRGQAVGLATGAWPSLGALVEDALTEPLSPLALLPICTGAACGAKPERLVPVAAAVVLAALALRIVDDCADDDNPHALHLEIGTGRALNAATSLSMVALQGLNGCGFVGGTPADDYIDAYVRVCRGQEEEKARPPQSLETYCELVQLKTVTAFEFGAWVGARLVTSDETLLDRCKRCGTHLGWMTQMLDDLEAQWFPDGPSDLAMGRLTFPALYALTLDHPERASLASLCERTPYDTTAIGALLDRMEVRRHLMSHALDHRDAALAALGAPLHPAGRALLEPWLTWTFRDGARLLG